MAAEERESSRESHEEAGGAGVGGSASHPVGTGVGVVGGAAAGAAAGMAAGPLGMAVGGVAGAVVGGLAGRAVAEAMNPADEESFWRERYTQEPYYEKGRGYEDYGPAYRYGLEARKNYEEDWDTAASRLQSGWENARDTSSLEWEHAKHASRAAWDRASGQVRGAASAMGSTSGDQAGDRDDLIDALNDLIECCKDGEYGFRSCADNARRGDLKTVFQQRAEDCRQGCVELQQQVRILGGDVEDSGSTLGAVHRGWVSVKSTLSTYDDKSILEEAERGEDSAKARYGKALAKPLPADIRQMVERQFQGVQRNHDQIKMLRDQLRAAG